MPEKDNKLAQEASFQDQRVVSTKREPRERFGYLYAGALDSYCTRLKELSRGKRLLVVGCSEYGVVPLAENCRQVVGIDISTASIDKQRKKIADAGLEDRVQAYVMNAEELEFEADSFDIICCSGVLHHLEVERALSSWSRVLTPDGELLMFEPMKLNPFAALYRVITPGQRTPFEHPLGIGDFDALRDRFKNVEFSANALFTPLSLACLPLPRKVGELVHRGLQGVDAALFRALPVTRYFAWSTIIHCSGLYRSGVAAGASGRG